jgi:DNA polymerase-3 subunit alpha
MGFAGYFLIVADFIRWARENGVPVGPAAARARLAGRLCARHHRHRPARARPAVRALPEPERVSMPDFDVDFCMEGRDRVIEYVADKYGRERVSQIITYGTMAAKAVVRDVGRVLGLSYGFVDKHREARSVRARHHARRARWRRSPSSSGSTKEDDERGTSSTSRARSRA